MWVYMSVYGCIWGTAGGKTHISQLSTCWLVTRIIIIFYHASYICPSLWSVSFPFSLPPWSPYYQDHLWYLVVYASAIGTWWSWKELAMVSTADASAWGQPLTSRARAKCTTAPSRVCVLYPAQWGLVFAEDTHFVSDLGTPYCTSAVTITWRLPSTVHLVVLPLTS